MKHSWKYLVLIGAFLMSMRGDASLKNDPVYHRQEADKRPCKYFIKRPYFGNNPGTPKLLVYYDGAKNWKKDRPIAILQSTFDNGYYDKMSIDEEKEHKYLRCHKPDGIAIESEENLGI